MRSRAPLAAAAAALLLLPAAPHGGGALPGAGASSVLFEDDFEAPEPWVHYDEMVPLPCYGWGIEVGASGRNASAARAGAWGFQVWANAARLPVSNHAFGAYRVAHAGHVAPLRYELHASLDPDPALRFQTGPEFSLQVTHEFPEGWRTLIAGLQYLPFTADGTWNIWVPHPVSGRGTWVPLLDQALVPGAWYSIALDVDLVALRYVAVRMEGPGLDLDVPLGGHAVPSEVKFVEAATWISLDAENLWTTCSLLGGVTQAKVRYDDVRLSLLPT